MCRRLIFAVVVLLHADLGSLVSASGRGRVVCNLPQAEATCAASGSHQPNLDSQRVGSSLMRLSSLRSAYPCHFRCDAQQQRSLAP